VQKSIVSKEYGLFLAFLKKVRLDAGITQVQIAKKLKTGQSFVSKVEKGERRLDIVELRLWLQTLRMPLIDFVVGFEAHLKKNRKILPKP
jgi:transcriptional regulator with XRE-family HTH domain